jgi:tetratricopeptide (TPR) repeat protein
MSLFYLHVASELRPGDREIAGKIADLQATIEKESEMHFKKGLAFYKDNSFKAAQREFLTALRYNPYHKQALDYLKNRLTVEGYRAYQVKEGDTPRSIAHSVYKDPEKDFLISYFTGTDTRAKLVPGTILRLPVLEAEFIREFIDIEEELLKAKDLVKTKDFEKVLPIVGKILEYDPENKEAADLANASYYEIGERLRLEKKYIASLKMLNRVSPGYEGIKEAIFDVTESLRKEAEIHYKVGVKHFLNEELEEAIKEWEQTLALNPDHQKARKDIEDARSLLDKLKKIKSDTPPPG